MSAQPLKAAKLLLVEDNELNRDMLSRRLQRRGFEVITAVDGETAVRIASESLPDLILMDLGLPGMSGWDAARLIRSHAQTGTIPIVALTAHALHPNRQSALDAGCDAFETKPIELERLLKTIQDLLLSRNRSNDV